VAYGSYRLPEVLKVQPYMSAAERDDFANAIRAAICKLPSVFYELQQMLYLYNESWERKTRQFLQFALKGL
jgi:hypothetical protein